MPTFHDNKLNTICLSEGEDQSYTPTKKPRSKPKSKPKFKPTLTKESDTTAMGCMSSSIPSKRGNEANSRAQVADMRNGGARVGFLYAEHGNPSIDSGMAGMPEEPISRAHSTDSSTAGYPIEAARWFRDYDLALARRRESALVAGLKQDWGNAPSHSYESLSDQDHLHHNGYDVDPRTPTGYPIGPRMDAFAAEENRRLFLEVAGNPYDSSEFAKKGRPAGQKVKSPISQNTGVASVVNDSYGNTQGPLHSEDQACEDEHDGGHDAPIKDEAGISDVVSSTPGDDSEYDESDYEERAFKFRKLNKDGAPRKSRQPRPKLLKWSDNDWKNVALGIVWACGENGLRIPFDQAAQVVGHSCTAGALQQALLKLRAKQIDEGNQIPLLRMAWTRRRQSSTSSAFSANAKNAQNSPLVNITVPTKKPTRQEGTQTQFITLKRAYREADRRHLEAPLRFTRTSHQQLGVRTGNAIMLNGTSSDNIDEQFSMGHDNYEDDGQVMEDTHDNLDNGFMQDPAIPDANGSSNDMTVMTANMNNGGTLPTQAFAHQQIPGFEIDSYESWMGNAQDDSAEDPTAASTTGQVDSDCTMNDAMDTNFQGSRLPTLRHFEPGESPFSDAKLRKRKTQIIDDRWHHHVSSTVPNFFDPGYVSATTFPTTFPTQYQGIDTPSDASSYYDWPGASTSSTVPTTPIANPVYSQNAGYGTPIVGPFVNPFDSTPVADGMSYDDMLNAYTTPTTSVAPFHTPPTPTRPVRAGPTVSDMLNSSMRLNSASNAQGTRGYMHRNVDALSDDMQDEVQPKIEDDEDLEYAKDGAFGDPFV